MTSFSPVLAALALALTVVAGPVWGQAVLVDKSEIRFVAKQLGVNVEGRFRKWKADVVFLPKDAAHSRAVFDIDLASIDLASEESEREVRDRLWFDMAKFPIAHFASTSVTDRGGGKYEITGELSIKGIARTIVVPFAMSKDAAGNSMAEGNVHPEAPRLQGRRRTVGGHRHRRERGRGPPPDSPVASEMRPWNDPGS